MRCRGGESWIKRWWISISICICICLFSICVCICLFSDCICICKMKPMWRGETERELAEEGGAAAAPLPTSLGLLHLPPPLHCENLYLLRRHLRRCHDMSPPNTHFWKWSNDIEKSESDLFWCKSMSNNVKSCKKINGRVQTFRFSVFTMGGHWLTGALSQKRGKQGKLKRELLKILNWYDLSRVEPCESWRPDDSKNVVVFEFWRF